MIKKKENPNVKISITEAEYAKGRRAYQRQLKLKELLKPVNQMLKNLREK